MSSIPKEIQDLSDLLSSLPGIGPKLSNRLALYLAVNGKSLALNLSHTLSEIISKVKTCEICGNVSLESVCDICKDTSRDRSTILVVEDSLDLFNIEASNIYRGLYHVLNGVISPINGVGPSDINISSLLKRIKEDEVKEVILALNPNVEGDSTSLYLKDQIENLDPNITITKLAKGIPAGSDLEFASTQTIVDSVKSRKQF
jgi:recombination protein RecR